ncbi:MAG: tetratricopeptide repeat protein [Rhodospirillaceae bacterium]|nr:tetratricopeptide repeat protein [Rhodospirillaceae bacterium]
MRQYENGAYKKAVSALQGAVSREPKSADANFYLGLSLYKLQRYTAAGSAFDQTIALDPQNGSALLFRGLAHQAGGAYAKAIPYFEKAIAVNSDLKQLADYNIGISQFRAGDNTAAKAALTRAIAAAPKSDTAKEAQDFLAKIEAGDGKSAKKWTASTSVGYQYDDNVTTDEVDTSSNLHDTAFILEAAATYQLHQGGAIDIEVGYDFFQSLYDDLTSFDLRSHTFSIVAEKEIADVDASAILLYTRTNLGGDDFLGIHSITPSLGYGFTPNWYASFSYNFQNKNFIGAEERDSEVHSVGVNNFVFFMDGKANVSFGYRIEDENTESSEFDYLGHFLHAKVKAPIPGAAIAKWNPTATLGWAYYNKNYNSLTASISDERQDERTTLSLGLTADVTTRVQAKFAYEKIEAISNLVTADFNENIATLSFGVTF